MASRPAKTAGNTTYTAEVAAGATTMKASEVDGDLNEIFTNITNVNVATGAAIATAKLAQDAGIQTGHLAAGAVTTTILANQPNGVTNGKLNVGSVVSNLVSVAVGAFNAGVAETVVATLPSFTARGASRVVVFGTVGMRFSIVTAGASVGLTLRLYVNRGGAGFSLLQSWDFLLDSGGSGTPTVPVPTPVYVDTATAATQVYELRAITSSTNGALVSSPTNRGQLFAVELA